jgi:hypothetical protein
MNKATRMGLLFFLIASISRWSMRPTTFLTTDRLDALNGLLYGMAIGCMLLGIWKNRKPGSTQTDS